MTGDCCVFKFLSRSADRKHLVRFQSENAVFKFLWRISQALRLRHTMPQIAVTRRRDRLLQQIASCDT